MHLEVAPVIKGLHFWQAFNNGVLWWLELSPSAFVAFNLQKNDLSKICALLFTLLTLSGAVWVSFIKKTDKHLFCKSYWAHAVSSDLQEKSCKAELNNLLWNAEVRQSIWGNTPPRNEKQHNSGSLQRPNAHEGSIRCTATFKSKDYSYESAMMIGLQNYIPYSLSSARSDFSSDVVCCRRETIIYESLNLLTSWYNCRVFAEDFDGQY